MARGRIGTVRHSAPETQTANLLTLLTHQVISATAFLTHLDLDLTAPTRFPLPAAAAAASTQRVLPTSVHSRSCPAVARTAGAAGQKSRLVHAALCALSDQSAERGRCRCLCAHIEARAHGAVQRPRWTQQRRCPTRARASLRSTVPYQNSKSGLYFCHFFVLVT